MTKYNRLKTASFKTLLCDSWALARAANLGGAEKFQTFPSVFGKFELFPVAVMKNALNRGSCCYILFLEVIRIKLKPSAGS